MLDTDIDTLLIHHDIARSVNQQWHIQALPQLEGHMEVTITWGRVGGKQVSAMRHASRSWVQRAIQQKRAMGYIDLPVVRTQPIPIGWRGTETSVLRVAEHILAEAKNDIDCYLDMPIRNITSDHIDRAYTLLEHIQPLARLWNTSKNRATLFDQIMPLAEQFYACIPVRLLRSATAASLVAALCRPGAIAQHAEKVLQIDAEVRQGSLFNPQTPAHEQLGGFLTEIACADPQYDQLAAWIHATCVHGYAIAIQNIFAINIPPERNLYLHNTRGATQRVMLFHGAHSALLRRILTRGLLCPLEAAHGRMFGNGIYFADAASKSANYCDATLPATPLMLLICEVALGQSYPAPHAYPFSEAPNGYDSVIAQPWTTENIVWNEYVVYHRSQQTIRYLVSFDVAT